MKMIIFAAALLAASPAFAGWRVTTDDGRKFNEVQADRDWAGCHAAGMGAIPYRSFGSDWSAQIGFNLDAGNAIKAVQVECMRSKGYIVTRQ